MKRKLILILMLLLLWPFSAYANSGEVHEFNSASDVQEDKGKTIRELKDNLDVLDDERDDLNGRLSSLKQEIELRDFFKEKLSSSEVVKIKEIMDLYKDYNAKLDKKLAQESKSFKLTTETKNDLLNERKELYKQLVPYIDSSKTSEYLEYIKTDAQILKESKDVKEEYHRKTEILNNKVEVVKEKIKENNRLMSEKLEKLINEKLAEKIENLKNNEKFQLLNNEFRVRVLDKTILSIETKIINLQDSTVSSSFILQKIKIYELALLKIKELKQEYKKEEEL